ncbi:hypothetical protein BC832DRAFT_595129 [Gaertneriomyces semiglobifer]|nr:hypothetical protein BC832DRAFT_595129 [Gaertneriomyces semiglobifer]
MLGTRPPSIITAGMNTSVAPSPLSPSTTTSKTMPRHTRDTKKPLLSPSSKAASLKRSNSFPPCRRASRIHNAMIARSEKPSHPDDMSRGKYWASQPTTCDDDDLQTLIATTPTTSNPKLRISPTHTPSTPSTPPSPNTPTLTKSVSFSSTMTVHRYEEWAKLLKDYRKEKKRDSKPGLFPWKRPDIKKWPLSSLFGSSI